MPQIDTSEWKVASQARAVDPGAIIEGDARDITDRGTVEEDAVDLSKEPEFHQSQSRDLGPSSLRNWVHALPYGPMRSLDPKKLHTKAKLFEQLNNILPLNEFNLPIYIYRPDLLDHVQIQEALLKVQSDNTPDQTLGEGVPTATTILSSPEKPVAGIEDIQSQLDAAQVPLEYHEGFPAFGDGKPFWNRLDYEPEAAYDAFIAYIDLGGARKRADLIAYPTDDLNEWFHIYFWAYRVKAFELFKVVDANKRRIFRMLQTEDSHFKIAERLLNKVNEVLNIFDADDWTEVGPEKLVGVLEKLVKVQRISVGLNANGGAVDPEDMRKSPTTQVIVQQVVKNTPEEERVQDDDLDLLRDSPDAVEMAQDMIIATQKQRL